MEEIIAWATPTFKRKQRTWAGKWAQVAQTLKDRPGEWALLRYCEAREGADQLASTIRLGLSGSWRPAGVFEARSEPAELGWAVYARYLGEK